MKTITCILLCLCVFHVAQAANTPEHVRSFFLEGVRSGRLYGPFRFQTGARIQLDTGDFRLDVLSAAGSFILTEQRSGAVFGVYELVPGRMIDAGYQLFTITRVTRTTMPNREHATSYPSGRSTQQETFYTTSQPFHQADYRVSIIVDLINQIAYDWTLDGEDGGSAKYMERRGATLALSRGILTIAAGVLLDAEWQETFQDPNEAFEEGRLSSGTGWKADLSLLVPVFEDGRWSAAVGGGVSYQRETFDLEYGQWETIDFNDNTTTNGLPNGTTNAVPSDVTSIAGESFIRQTQSATLSETVVNVTARLDYTAPNWFAFAGLHAEPWSDTDLQATIELDNQRIPLSFSRRHPFSGYVGAGFTYQDVHSYLKFKAGGVNAIRMGVTLSF